ncbi:MAG: hypothetical protein KME14_26670 [Tildeniella torsiva UHER 1998/13D]|jgi:hypothetical protein|nr:hypothetical protein [Tildeniella torsiva UHER 1998/13D]
MSLDLINVGIEPNDGTGDPPRVAGQKINANFQELYLAVAATEPTTALDARDTANRDRANHTGTQPAVTISDFSATAAAAAPVQSVAGRTGNVTLTQADVGLDQLDNTADADKPLSTATEAVLDLLSSNIQAALEQKLEAADIAAFETNAQLDTRDTGNRARANHTGAQAISTVTGLQTALDAKLEAAAIASFETTTQLNARDTVNRARANHTGTQPANTVSGLASVATSGAYSDLSGKPTSPYGFTYDQQAEPSGPAAGATWRERSAGGLILGEWEWSGSLWLSGERYAPLYSGVSASANTSGVMSIYPKYPVVLTGYTASFTQPFAPQDASNHWLFRHGGLGLVDWLTTIDQSTIAPTFLQKILATPVVIAGPTASDNFASRVGSPGNLRHFMAITHYKLIRP